MNYLKVLKLLCQGLREDITEVTPVCEDGQSRCHTAVGDLANWMSNNSETLQYKHIKELHLPGSHNSASHTINTITRQLSKCQNVSISEQLDMGVRYLDLRVGNYSGFPHYVSAPVVCHGLRGYGAPAVEILNEIREWSESHPKEILLIKLSEEHKQWLSDHQAMTLSQAIHEILVDSGRLFKSSEVYEGILELKLWDIWARHTPILMFLNGPNNILRKQLEGYVQNAGKVLYDPWFNTSRADALVSACEAYVPRRDRLSVLQLILSPKTDGDMDSVRNLTAKLCGSAAFTEWANRHYPQRGTDEFFERTVREGSTAPSVENPGRMNTDMYTFPAVVLCDYVCMHSGLFEAVIAFNLR